MIIVSFILILAFALSIVMMKNDYISKNQANPSKEQMVGNTDGSVLIITGENWDDYFELVDEVKYDKNEKGEVTAVYQESWFDLKDEYQSRLDKDADNRATFVCNADVKLKEYKITDPQTGEFEIVDDGPEIKYNGKTNRKTAIWESRQKGIIVERYVGEEPYMYTYDELKLIEASGTIYLKEE